MLPQLLLADRGSHPFLSSRLSSPVGSNLMIFRIKDNFSNTLCHCHQRGNTWLSHNSIKSSQNKLPTHLRDRGSSPCDNQRYQNRQGEAMLLVTLECLDNPFLSITGFARKMHHVRLLSQKKNKLSFVKIHFQTFDDKLRLRRERQMAKFLSFSLNLLRLYLHVRHF